MCRTKEQLLEDLEENIKFYQNQNSKILSLDNFTDVYVSRNYMSGVKGQSELLKSKRAKGALIGITGIKKTLLNGYVKISGENLKAFDTKEEALEYLVS